MILHKYAVGELCQISFNCGCENINYVKSAKASITVHGQLDLW